jgi:hypothetical protein
MLESLRGTSLKFKATACSPEKEAAVALNGGYVYASSKFFKDSKTFSMGISSSYRFGTFIGAFNATDFDVDEF